MLAQSSGLGVRATDAASNEPDYDTLFNDPEFKKGGTEEDSLGATASGDYLSTQSIIDQGTTLLSYGKYLMKLGDYARNQGLGEEVATEIDGYSAQVTQLGQQLRAAETIRITSAQATFFVGGSVFAIGKSLRLIGESIGEGDTKQKDALLHVGQSMVLAAQNLENLSTAGEKNGGNIDLAAYERQLSAVKWLLVATRAIDTSMRSGKFVQATITSSVSAERGKTYQLISFSAIDTVDPLGTIGQNNLFWDFGDGEFQTGTFVTHPFSKAGRYPVQLYAIGPTGFGMDSTVIKIEPVLPVAVLSTDQESLVGPHDDALSIVQGQNVLFSAKNSFDPSDPKRSFTYVWDFGDGTTDDIQGPTIYHSFADAREYTVLLTIKTGEGLSATAFKVVRVLPTPPKARMSVRREADSLEAGVSKDAFVDHASGPVTLVFSAAKSRGAPTGESGSTSRLMKAVWDFGDGARIEQSEKDLAASQPVTHRYERAGRYVVSLEVTDDQKSVDVVDKTILLLDPEIPTADFTSDAGSEMTTHRTITFDASVSRSAYAPIVSYAWELRPVKQDPIKTGMGKTFAASIDTPGSYEISLVTKDANGEQSPRVTQRLDVLSTPPRASFAFRRSADEPNVFIFDAASSTDPDGDALAYSWDFNGDGTYDDVKRSSPSIQHLFDTIGKTSVSLRVTDSFNRATTVTRELHVDSTLVVRIQPDTSTPPAGPSPLTVSLLGTAYLNLASGHDVNNVQRLDWDFGDGTRASADVTDGISRQTHTFTSASGLRTATISLTATDAYGNRRRTTLAVSVGQPGEVIPVIAISPELPELGTTATPYSFSAVGSVSARGLPTGLTAHWDFGDNTGIAEGMRLTHRYAAPGTYTVALSLTDETSSKLARLTRTVEVKREPAIALYFAGPLEGVAPHGVTFDAAASIDPNGAIQSYTWTFGDGVVSRQPTPRVVHDYTKPGTYVSRLSITDSSGSKVDSEPVTITVR